MSIPLFNPFPLIMDEKYTSSAVGRTKRRKYTTFGPATSASAISQRVSRLQKSLKASSPPHLWSVDVGSQSSFNTTGGVYDLLTNIQQGDAYNQRFGNRITALRVNLRGTVVPGLTQTNAVTCRLSLVRAPFNIGAGRIDNVTISPTANTNILQVYWDKVFTLANSVTSQPYPVNFNVSVKLPKTLFKFSGSGTGAAVG